MKNIHTVTVMHSGTHLLQTILNHDQRFQGPDRLIRYHVDTVHNDKIEDASFVFSALRHPRRIAESWRRRFVDGKYNLTFQYLYEQLDSLMNDFDKYIDIYVHVDDIATRDKEVDLISDMIGVKINPFDWSKADRDTGCNYQTHDIDIKDCPVVPPKYEDFYYRTMNRDRSATGRYKLGEDNGKQRTYNN